MKKELSVALKCQVRARWHYRIALSANRISSLLYWQIGLLLDGTYDTKTRSWIKKIDFD